MLVGKKKVVNFLKLVGIFGALFFAFLPHRAAAQMAVYDFNNYLMQFDSWTRNYNNVMQEWGFLTEQDRLFLENLQMMTRQIRFAVDTAGTIYNMDRYIENKDVFRLLAGANRLERNLSAMGMETGASGEVLADVGAYFQLPGIRDYAREVRLREWREEQARRRADSSARRQSAAGQELQDQILRDATRQARLDQIAAQEEAIALLRQQNEGLRDDIEDMSSGGRGITPEALAGVGIAQRSAASGQMDLLIDQNAVIQSQLERLVDHQDAEADAIADEAALRRQGDEDMARAAAAKWADARGGLVDSFFNGPRDQVDGQP